MSLTPRSNFWPSAWLLPALLLLPSSTSAELSPVLKEALTQPGLLKGPARGWGFVRTTREGKNSRTEAYDPSQPPGEEWTLLLLNGRPPSDREARHYREAQLVRADRRAKAHEKMNGAVPPAPKRPTIRLADYSDKMVAETPAAFTYHVDGLIPMKELQPPDNEVPFLLRGLTHAVEKRLARTQFHADFVVDRATKTLRSLHLWVDPFNYIVHEEVVDVRVEFSPVADKIPPQTIRMSTRVKGHILVGLPGLKIDQDREETYSDFKHKGVLEADVSFGPPQVLELDVPVGR